ncbi:hypothetical protein B0H16DRAFT_1571519 [Mycena metata]|uniref:Uncharacterized protein n=1 Tax=Mycena metata TaxID=1033252 RepID=A0AAD7IAG3_9AGAR|nr:hypothetical protein B0H16DRAFT_1571519 [Mycena metata]
MVSLLPPSRVIFFFLHSLSCVLHSGPLRLPLLLIFAPLPYPTPLHFISFFFFRFVVILHFTSLLRT